jgi:hypothetical protein
VEKNMKRLPWWSSGIGLLVFCLIHAVVRWVVDVRDFPGAAGTLSIYRATKGDEGNDWAAFFMYNVQQYLDCSMPTAAIMVSILGGFLAVMGTTLGGWALGGKHGAVGAGMVTACWTLTHYFAILTGQDPVSFALPWLAVGLCWAGFRAGIIGVPLLVIGAALIPFSVGVKELALPAVTFVVFAPIMIQRLHWSLLVGIPLALYSSYWGFEWYWPEQSHRLSQTPEVDWIPLKQGWYRLTELYVRGLPEGKFDQLIIASLLLQFVSLKGLWRRLSIAIFAACVVMVTAFSLEGLARPRYIAPATYGTIVTLGVGLGLLIKRFTKGWIITVLFSGFLLIDSWGFFYVWGNLRTEMTGATEVRLPTPPKAWLAQYRNTTDITLRDLSLYGGVELAAMVEESGQRGVAIPRLRDERHRSLMAFAAMYNAPFTVLDPGKCCSGRGVGPKCAADIIQQVNNAGLFLFIPTSIKGVERVHANEENWRTYLQNAAEELGSTSESSYWVTRPSKGGGGPIPCQKNVPFRKKK